MSPKDVAPVDMGYGQLLNLGPSSWEHRGQKSGNFRFHMPPIDVADFVAGNWAWVMCSYWILGSAFRNIGARVR